MYSFSCCLKTVYANSICPRDTARWNKKFKVKNVIYSKGCRQKKTNSIFTDSVQIGGREVNPISKKLKQMIFWQKMEREGVTKYIVKNRSTLFCMIYYSIWPNQGTLCPSDCTPDPQKVIRMIENVNSKPKMSRFLSKILGEGGRSTWSTLCQK